MKKEGERREGDSAKQSEIEPERIVAHFDKRCHTRWETALDQPGQTISRLENRPVVFRRP
jgi:hypothetical protein